MNGIESLLVDSLTCRHLIRIDTKPPTTMAHDMNAPSGKCSGRIVISPSNQEETIIPPQLEAFQ